MDLQTITDQANDLAVLRLEIQVLEVEYKTELEAHTKLTKLQSKLDSLKHDKELAQAEVMESLVKAGLKTIKTEHATIARAKRETVGITKEMKPVFLARLRGGEEIDGLELKTTEYISIRAVK